MPSINRRTLLSGAAAAAGATVVAPTALASPALADTTAADTAVDQRTLRNALDYAVRKVRAVAPGITSFPNESKFEKWTYVDNGGWVGGFWPGILWMSYLDSGDALFRRLAEESAQRLAPRQDDTGTHDLGFLFYPSWVTAWRLTGVETWRTGALRAANSVSQRYNPRGRFIRAWGALGTSDREGRTIIDTMMNLDLLMFATEQTGEGKYADIAIAHAQTTAKHFVRPDGSTPHAFDFDPATGNPIGPNTVQGYSPTSCWSRGQAWGIYGFTTMYRRTGDREFLTTASKLADYALGVLTPDHVPVWDFRSPYAPNDIKDASAGAIMACGLLDLAKATGRDRYRDRALRMLDALCRTCLTTASTRADAVLARCTRHRPNESVIEGSLPYGDYYLLEALMRVLRPAEVARAIGL